MREVAPGANRDARDQDHRQQRGLQTSSSSLLPNVTSTGTLLCERRAKPACSQDSEQAAIFLHLADLRGARCGRQRMAQAAIFAGLFTGH